MAKDLMVSYAVGSRHSTVGSRQIEDCRLRTVFVFFSSGYTGLGCCIKFLETEKCII
ncbi:hypothetical protein KsCSTR_37620 [Candidatus Kuenenia stuttgartiensis]|uniref:Uncharacterized protein n=1 Tax=Kuenenia stuttgartiensis TaxID=174633 RepID=Q1Q667_KUEST|nr:hypothetical protein KsCSTR_37620 [Candidatus Kuenenia stuttgartiensis]CAJ73060.1 unknown protein [Candidatus Kuenenia stuttgartiensis]